MSLAAILGTVGIVGAVVAIGVVIDRRWPLLPRQDAFAAINATHATRARQPPSPPGTVASAALRATGPHLAHALGAQRCATCTGRLDAGPSAPVRYGERELQLFRLTCGTCHTGRGLYVELIHAGESDPRTQDTG